MAETLLAILLVISSAKGSTLVYHYPPDPQVPPRLRRALPSSLGQKHDIDPSYRWERANSSNRDRSLSYTQAPSSGRNTPTSNELDELDDLQEIRDKGKYQNVFGYSSEFLASILCPNSSMCHQKFELIVDDLAFIGHPVCTDSDGVWRFKPEKVNKNNSLTRGRNSRNRGGESGSASPAMRSLSLDKEKEKTRGSSTWLHTFHFVLVLDLPDPSSSASGNLIKYFDILYDQIAFIIAAVLFQEQVLSNFVEQECDTLVSLKDSCTHKGDPYSQFSTQALEISSIAASMKALYDAIKSSSMAYLSIHELPLELQLPPYLDDLLHSEEDNELDTLNADDSLELWGPEMSFGWQLPALAPWKSLLLLNDIDSEEGEDAFANLRSPYVTPDDRGIVEGLMRFLETVTVTLSLADLASLLDWDLETQIFPTVRWLVQHRKAKVVDVVNGSLKTVFTLPAKFNLPLSELTAEFEKAFPPAPPSSSSSHHPLTLPEILSTISTSSSAQTGSTTFFASVLQSQKDLLPIYHQVVLWMLKRDMLIVLHLRVKIVVTVEVKALVREYDANAKRVKRQTKDRPDQEKTMKPNGSNGNEHQSERGRKRGSAKLRSDLVKDTQWEREKNGDGVAWLSLSPKSARKYSQSGAPSRVPSRSSDSGSSKLSELIIEEDYDDPSDRDEESCDQAGKGDEDEDEDEETEGDTEAGSENIPSMINDPGRATTLQRRWLTAMSLGKDSNVARRFELINQYFDGKTTDDEILYRAEITKKQLREVLHHYDEFLQTFLHPS